MKYADRLKKLGLYSLKHTRLNQRLYDRPTLGLRQVDEIEEFNVDSKAECDQLNLAREYIGGVAAYIFSDLAHVGKNIKKKKKKKP